MVARLVARVARASKQESLAADLLSLAQRFDTAKDGTMVVPGEYLEVVIVRG
jgi:hypothetical protein